MHTETLDINGVKVKLVTLNTLIVGSGAAGYAAAVRLFPMCRDIALLTEGVRRGTSRNTGSDKQTYYKVSMSGDRPDCAAEMAKDLFAGKCMDGDLAMAEAAGSVPCFLRLCELGVPFPVNRFGEYVGYQTDHDTRARATSAGPLTSKLMTEVLEADACAKGVPVFDRHLAVELLTDGTQAAGILALNVDNGSYALFHCRSVIYATGGPAGIYADSVYPGSHNGGSGVPLRAGIPGRNLTEWQYGLASVQPRWNVSGTYMQVLPRFVSVDAQGGEHEFLTEYFADDGKMLSAIFQKGYEWPFDSRRAVSGSSVIDLLVYRESVLKNRKVYLDFRSNPNLRGELDFSLLSAEAGDYLSGAGACFGTPLDRLLHMNAPAYDLYLSKGVDLKTSMLEIALCAQHNNGGLAVDLWWQTELPGFFVVGEAAGTHGVYRPGGSALNAGQVGALRAARYAAARRPGAPENRDGFLKAAKDAASVHLRRQHGILSAEDTVGALRRELTREMSAVGGPIRDPELMEKALERRRELYSRFWETVRVPSLQVLQEAYRLYDILTCQIAYLYAMLDYRRTGGGSRGSALYPDPDGEAPRNMEEMFRFLRDSGARDGMVQEVCFSKDGCESRWRPVHPLPESGGFFENIWRDYRENENVF